MEHYFKKFIKMIGLLICTLAFIGCSAKRTKYQPLDDSGGYIDKKIDNRLKTTTFFGNAYTKKNDASAFSQFRAIELCKENGYRAAFIYEIKDLSLSKTVNKSASNTNQEPRYINGTGSTSTSYNSYSGSGSGYTDYSGNISGGSSQTNTSSWQETYIYPVFETNYVCSNSVNLMKIKLKLIKSEEMKNITSDLMGALQIVDIMDGSENLGVLKVGDIIIKVNDERIQNQAQLIRAVDMLSDKNKIPVMLIRDGNRISINAKASESIEAIESEESKFISQLCKVNEIKKRLICMQNINQNK